MKRHFIQKFYDWKEEDVHKQKKEQSNYAKCKLAKNTEERK